MITALSENVVVLAQNAYGNYALQVALEVIFSYIYNCKLFSVGQMKIANFFIKH